MKKTMLFVCFGLIILSCYKEKSQSSSTNKTKKQSTVQLKSISQAENPYEFVGEIHNIALGEVWYHPNRKNLILEERINIIQQVVYSELVSRGIQPSQENFDFSETTINEITESGDGPKDFMRIFNDMKPSERQFILNFRNELQVYENHKNSGLTIANIKRIENQVNAHQQMDSEQKELILSMLSIGRHSFTFWKEDNEIDPQPAASWLGRVWADIKGFFVGWREGHRGTLGDRWDYAVSSGSASSDQAGYYSNSYYWNRRR